MQHTLIQPIQQPSALKRHYYAVVTATLLLADVASIVLAFYLAFKLRTWIPIPERAQGALRFYQFLPMLVIQLVCIVTAFFFARMYHRRRTRYSSDEMTGIFSAVSIGTLVSIAIASFTFKSDSVQFDYPRVMVVYAWLLTIAFVIVARAMQARIQRMLQAHGYGRTRVVIIGSGDPAATVLQRIKGTPRLGYDIVGLVPAAAGQDSSWSAPDVAVLGGATVCGGV